MPGNLVVFANATGTEQFTDQAVAGTVMERPAGGGPTNAGSMAISQVSTGSQCLSVAPVQSVNFTVSNTYEVWPVNATSGAIAVTMPPAATNPGLRSVIFKTDSSGNDVNIGPTSGDNINGSTSSSAVALSSQYQAQSLRSVNVALSNTWLKA